MTRRFMLALVLLGCGGSPPLTAARAAPALRRCPELHWADEGHWAVIASLSAQAGASRDAEIHRTIALAESWSHEARVLRVMVVGVAGMDVEVARSSAREVAETLIGAGVPREMMDDIGPQPRLHSVAWWTSRLSVAPRVDVLVRTRCRWEYRVLEGRLHFAAESAELVSEPSALDAIAAELRRRDRLARVHIEVDGSETLRQARALNVARALSERGFPIGLFDLGGAGPAPDVAQLKAANIAGRIAPGSPAPVLARVGGGA